MCLYSSYFAALLLLEVRSRNNYILTYLANEVGIHIDVSLQLFDEISAPHILHNKCIAVSPGPSDVSRRNILNEEVDLLQNPPPRPPIECIVS